MRADILCARDLGIVGRDDGGGEIQESGPGVGNAVNGRRDKCATADGVTFAREFPEAIGRIHWDVGDAPSVLGSVDVAEVVVARGALLQVCCEKRRG